LNTRSKEPAPGSAPGGTEETKNPGSGVTETVDKVNSHSQQYLQSYHIYDTMLYL